MIIFIALIGVAVFAIFAHLLYPPGDRTPPHWKALGAILVAVFGIPVLAISAALVVMLIPLTAISGAFDALRRRR